MPTAGQRLRALPSVDEFLRSAGGQALLQHHPRSLVLSVLRGVLDARRREIRAGKADGAPLEARLQAAVEEAARPGLRRAVNATGVLLHTGLGRAPLAQAAREAVAACAGATTLEIDPETGERGQRDLAVSRLLCQLTGAEAALVVNNNAAATLLLLNTLAKDKEVVVSRGELVEIGGAYRMPDVMAAAGVRMVEVGTTNKTRIGDYAKAVRKGQTGLLIKVHTSNYRVVGFHEEAGLGEMVALGKRKGIPVAHDLGSGAMAPLADEPMVSESLKSGAVAVCFSGDKLLGGPQAGILLGKRKALAAMRANPLTRALRPGKLTLAALEATLRLYLEPERLEERLPLRGMLGRTPKVLQGMAESLAWRLKALGLQAEVKESRAQVGSGSVPGQELESRAVALSHPAFPAAELARRLRAAPVPVFSRVQAGRVWLDLRTLAEGDEDLVADAARAAVAG